MFKLIKLFFEVCLLKKGPQDLPYSVSLLKSSALLYAAVGLLLLHLASDLMTSILQLVTELILLFVLSWAILVIGRKPERFNQTAMALLGTDALLSFFSLPVLSAMMVPQEITIASPILLILMLWHWLVSGHIFRHALNKPLYFGLGVASVYILSIYKVMAMLFFEFVETVQ